MPAWNHWFHVTTSTYGTWLRGDPRGWRARHHREHCEGDYRHRPDPAEHAEVLRQSKESMTREPVSIAPELRSVVANAVAQRLVEDSIDVLTIAMGAKHLHLLAKFPQSDPRIRLGIAKQFSTTALKAHCSAVGLDLGLKKGEGIRGKRSHSEPIADREHQIEALIYIVGHVFERSALWLAPCLEERRAEFVRRAGEKRKRRDR